MAWQVVSNIKGPPGDPGLQGDAGPEGDPGVAGDPGPPGDRGTKFYTGQGAPDPGVDAPDAEPDDLYLDTDSGEIYKLA